MKTPTTKIKINLQISNVTTAVTNHIPLGTGKLWYKGTEFTDGIVNWDSAYCNCATGLRSVWEKNVAMCLAR